MKRIIAILIILLALYACYDAVSAQSRLTLIQRDVIGLTVYVKYDISLGPAPKVEAIGGYSDTILVSDSGQWRGRIYAELPCGARLVVDGVEVIRQQCLYFPIGAR